LFVQTTLKNAVTPKEISGTFTAQLRLTKPPYLEAFLHSAIFAR